MDTQTRQADQRWIRTLRHAAGVRDFDFTPAMIVALASVVARDLAIGAGDTELSILARLRAAVVLSIRVFLFRGAGKTNEHRFCRRRDHRRSEVVGTKLLLPSPRRNALRTGAGRALSNSARTNGP